MGKEVVLFFRKSSWIVVYLKFKLNKVEFHSDFKSHGVPVTGISIHSKVSIGRKFEMNNGLYNNMIGRQQPCFIMVGKDNELIIGDNVGMSGTAIICRHKITIGNNVRIGGGTVIYDSDFHSLNPIERTSLPEITDNIQVGEVTIKDYAFIGANCTILKGVTIGRNSIVGACTVVTSDIPDNEIWGGNPAKFIKKTESII